MREETNRVILSMKINNRVGDLRFESKTESAKSLMKIVEMTAKLNNVTVCETLAALVEEALMSNDETTYHVNGIEFLQACDKAITAAH